MKNTSFRRSITALAVAASLGFALPALADNTTANISGSINANNYSEYTVTAKDPATGLEREISVSDEGSFRFAKLPTGVYDIQVVRLRLVALRLLKTLVISMVWKLPTPVKV